MLQKFSSAGLDPIIIGASGIVRNGNTLLIAADKVPGAYFQYQLHDQPGPAIPFQPQYLTCKFVPHAELSLDLEGINVLADGRVVVLSEALFSLIGEKGIVAQYPESFTEFGGLGLEGVAVRAEQDETSNVAVVWEGGYPQAEKIPFQIKDSVSKIAFNPVILLHKILKNESADLKGNALTILELQVPKLPGKEPYAQRFRVPDLVWHILHTGSDGQEEWGFIVLLSSQNEEEPREYLNLWLQRFDLKGKTFGEPLDLKRIFPDDLKKMNWEGMSWFEMGKSLVLTYDNTAEQSPEAYILELPKGW